MKLLTDEELREYIDDLMYLYKQAGNNTVRLDARKRMYSLIESQKKAYAEYVIGEDDEISFDGIPMEDTIKMMRHNVVRKGLRVEQRERNK